MAIEGGRKPGGSDTNEEFSLTDHVKELLLFAFERAGYIPTADELNHVKLHLESDDPWENGDDPIGD